MNSRFKALLALLLAVPVLWLAPTDAEAQGRPAAVGVDTVRTEPLSQTVPVIGRLVARQAGAVSTRIEGLVDVMTVDVGDRVEKDDVVAKLRDDLLGAQRDEARAALTAAQARITSAEAEIALARQERDRQAGLKGSSAFSQARFDDADQTLLRAEADAASARAAAAEAQAKLSAWQIRIQDATIRAPYPGVVTVKHVARGTYVSPGEPIVDLVNDVDLEVEADVPATRLGGLQAGVVIEISVDNKVRQFGVVRAVVPSENPLTRTRAVRFTPNFGGPGTGLAAGQTVTVHLPVGEERTVVTVHKDAVSAIHGGHQVFVVIDGAATPRRIRIGESVGSRFEVLNGLDAGEVVVTRGNERLRPGQPVNPIQNGGDGSNATPPADGTGQQSARQTATKSEG
ncbi:MAG: efflux RND transporter periplasmic adaptor subunit [Alphaproteobacteria bacterium]|nr:efflux RND transporter periplasmic adaptor subunit [Alphaproteobacteria bacterium]